MKRIVFLDYIRVFACFLVILVHASENFYGAPGSTDMAGPQSFLANEADRLWVSVYDGFSRMAVPLFMIVSAFLLAPMKEEQSMWQFYRQRCLRILPPFFIFMLLQHSTYVVGTDRRRNIYEGLVADIPEFPDASRTLVVYVSSDKSLFVYPNYIPMVEKSHG